MAEGPIPIHNREDYCSQYGSEKANVLLWRKLCSRMQRGFSNARMRRLFARLMGVNVLRERGKRHPFIAIDVYLDDTFPELITIMPRVDIAMRCIILCHDDTSRKVAGVVLEEGCYLGAGAIILPGVRIGKDAIVAAGAVVHRSVPAGELWSGNPARPAGYTKYHRMVPSQTRANEI